MLAVAELAVTSMKMAESISRHLYKHSSEFEDSDAT